MPRRREGVHVQTFFVGLLSGSRTADVRAFATCGLELASAPIPILVLDPKNPNVRPASSALDVQGNPAISIVGGPTKSIQVNSSDPAATNVGGSGTIDLSKGGPNGTGSDIGIYGGPATAPAGFNGGTSGHWVSPAAPINDPFAQLPAPAVPLTAGGLSTVAGPTTSPIVCPDTQCAKYTPGYYAAGICVGKSAGCTCIGSSNTCTAIFDPGIYYIHAVLQICSEPVPHGVSKSVSRSEAVGISHRVPCLQPWSFIRTSTAGKFG